MKCDCGSGRASADCCDPCLIAGVAAPSAEALMRSRYTAYVRGDAAYLLATWHASTRPSEIDAGPEPHMKWIGLDVRQAAVQDADHATVEFVARYRIGGRAHRLHEQSRFVRDDGRWFYVDGTLFNT
jgi:SEC-C motif-containing protein